MLEKSHAADWDWLIGLYYADGCKFIDRWHRVVVFTISMSENYILAKLLHILNSKGLSPSIHAKPYGRRALDVRTYNREFFELLPEKSNPYRPAVPLAYLAGLFDGDGYIARPGGDEKWIFNQAKYQHLAVQVQDIISDYGRVTLHTYSRQKGWLPISRVSVLRDARKKLRRTDFAHYCVRLVVLDKTDELVPGAGLSQDNCPVLNRRHFGA